MTVTPLAATAARPTPAFRGRLGRDARSGHYAVPRRYRLHLSPADPDCLRIAVTHSLLGLDAACPVTELPAVPDAPGGEHSALRPLYEASAHRYSGAATVPVLSDDWSGRIVSTYTPDILRDLARHFGAGRFALYPCGLEGRSRRSSGCARRGSTRRRSGRETPAVRMSTVLTRLARCCGRWGRWTHGLPLIRICWVSD